MGLTTEDVRKLQAAFPRKAHEFKGGYVFISEEAISDRLDSVDPSWTFQIINTHYTDDQAIVTARLTVGEVMRDGIGMHPLFDVDRNGVKTPNRADPAKSAATDALKRAARLFSIGRYLLEQPPKEGGSFDEWLVTKQKSYPPLAEQQKDYDMDAPPQAAPTPERSSTTPPNWPVVKRDTADLFDSEYAQDAVIARGKSEGWLHDRQTTALAIQSLKDNREVKSAHWTSDVEALEKFVTWSLGWVEHKKDVFTALRQAVDYEMKKNEDYRGTKLEAMAAVVAYFSSYKKTQIQASVGKATDIPDATKAQVVTAAIQLVDRKPQLTVQPEPIASGK